MMIADYLLAGVVAVIAGLDRTAAFQFMLSRPIVAAPLTGLLLGSPLTGLQVGALIELLWLGRLPVGAAIPPDDTQVAVGGTAIAVGMGSALGMAGFPFAILATLVALPLGKVGQLFDRAARHWNVRLLMQAEADVNAGRLETFEKLHLRGLVHFALCSLGTYVSIVVIGSVFLQMIAPTLVEPVSAGANWLRLVFIVLGAAAILGTINVSRSMSLFAASFSTAFLMLWLL
jgi:mannose PTS system EIIC component